MTLQYFATWYILFFIFGIIGLPITNWLFKDWIDRGYGFAKFVGMFAVSMPLWFLSSLHIIPFTPLACALYVLIAIAIAGLAIYRQEIKITRFMVISEVLFFANMLVWALVRGMNPRAEGTEKFMNLAFMNSINRTEYFPAADPWYVGGDINYYHLGHYMFVFASQVIAVPISYVYNLALITIIAQTFVGLFSIIINFSTKAKDWVKPYSAYLVAFGCVMGPICTMHSIGSQPKPKEKNSSTSSLIRLASSPMLSMSSQRTVSCLEMCIVTIWLCHFWLSV